MNTPENLGDKVVADVKKDFVAVGKNHVHGWYAWAIVGIVVGMFGGLIYVSNWKGQFDAGQAMIICPAMKSPFPFAAVGSAFQWIPGGSDAETTSEVNTRYYFNDDGTPKKQPVYDKVIVHDDGSVTESGLLGYVPDGTAVRYYQDTKAAAVADCQGKLAASQAAAQAQCDAQQPVCESLPVCAYSTVAEPDVCSEPSCTIASRPAPAMNMYDTETQWGIECTSVAPVKKVSCSCTNSGKVLRPPVQRSSAQIIEEPSKTPKSTRGIMSPGIK